MKKAQRLASRLPPKWSRRVREAGKVLINYRGARSTGARGILFNLVSRYSPMVATEYGNGRILVDTNDGEIGRSLFITHDYERRYMGAAVDYLKQAGGASPGPVFVDVGANIGISTLDALLHFGFEKAVCFEPDSRNFRILKMNLVLNDLDEKVSAHRMALSNCEGERLLQRTDGNSGDSQLVTPTDAGGPGGGDREMCEITRLDCYLDAHPGLLEQIGLLWIDAQGHDPLVLQGAERLMKRGTPVVVEYWPKGLRAHSALDLFETLAGDNYSSVVDLRVLSDGNLAQATIPTSEIRSLRGYYLDEEFTDLLLLK
ncbi:MAG: FkbM family methyltransferase [Actinomycetota bacterium]